MGARYGFEPHKRKNHRHGTQLLDRAKVAQQGGHRFCICIHSDLSLPPLATVTSAPMVATLWGLFLYKEFGELGFETRTVTNTPTPHSQPLTHAHARLVW